jgi:hypothetical protein
MIRGYALKSRDRVLYDICQLALRTGKPAGVPDAPICLDSRAVNVGRTREHQDKHASRLLKFDHITIFATPCLEESVKNSSGALVGNPVSDSQCSSGRPSSSSPAGQAGWASYAPFSPSLELCCTYLARSSYTRYSRIQRRRAATLSSLACRRPRAFTFNADITDKAVIGRLFTTESGAPDVIYVLHAIMLRGLRDNFDLGIKLCGSCACEERSGWPDGVCR